MKKLLPLLALVLLMFFVSCSDYNQYRFAAEGRRSLYAAYVGNNAFKTIQKAIDFICTGVKGKALNVTVPENQTIHVVKNALSDSTLTFPAGYNGDILLDMNNATYTFTSDTTVGFKILGGEHVYVKDGTFVISEDNRDLEYVYYITSNYIQDQVVIKDLRPINKDNCTSYADSQKIYIAGGQEVSFGYSSSEEPNVTGWLTMEQGANLALVSGSYTFWGINGSGDLAIHDGTVVTIFETEQARVNAAISPSDIVTVNILDESHIHHYGEEKTRAASCSKEGCLWHQCTDCGHGDVITTYGKLPHDTENCAWQVFGSDGHKAICNACGETVGELTAHDYQWRTTATTHTLCCSACGYQGREEAIHTPGNDGICTVCGYKVDGSSDGFRLEFVDNAPSCIVNHSVEGDLHTFTLISQKEGEKAQPTATEWKLCYYDDEGNEVILKEENDFRMVFTFTVDKASAAYREYHVKYLELICIYSNESGRYSASTGMPAWEL